MRIDRFLKMSRIVKRRTVAQEMADIGAVRINGRTAKPSSDACVGDTVEIAFPRRVLTVKILTDDDKEIKRGKPSYDVIGERRVTEDEKPW